MNEPTSIVPMMTPPAALEAARAVQEAQRMFGRTLASWTVDLLDLRRRGITEVTWRQTGARWRHAA